MRIKENKRIKAAVITVVLIILGGVFGLSQTEIDEVETVLNPVDPGFARVVRVVDGDTIEINHGSKNEKVRLVGVDTPETSHPNKAVQCFGYAAKEYLEGLIDDKDVRLERDELSSDIDRYNRLLRYVYLKDGTLVNLEIIKEGYGFAYTSFDFEKEDEFSAAQKMASAENKGLWGSCEIEKSDNSQLNTAPAEDE